jgi:hypothetical protein
LYHVPIATYKRIIRGESPIIYMKITTHLGDRVYAKKVITASAIAGSLGCLARVLSFGSFDRTLNPKTSDLLAAYNRKQQQHISVTLDNADSYFSILLGKEPFLSRPIAIYVGFEDEAAVNHITIFKGVISLVSVLSILSIEADEKSSASPTGMTLDDTFYLPRSSRYTNPLNTADLLPVVYGDLSDGAEGVWVCPCIDTVNHVYCYACHPIFTAQTPAIYSAGVLVDPADYTFNSSDYFEPPVPPPAIHLSTDNIATITFTASQGTNVITARGKGKVFQPITLAGEILIDNIIDIVEDFLTTENDFTPTLFEATKKALASEIFDKWSYVAAGVIHQDGTLWDIITSMMASFLGSAYLDGSGNLCLEIDDGTIDQLSAGVGPTLPKQETNLVSANLRIADVVNQCPCNYGYSYLYGQFRHSTDDSTHADGISQGVYGVREPGTPYQFYWCRNVTVVKKIQDVIVGKFNSPLYEIEVEDSTLKRMYIDVGDVITYSADHLYDQAGNPLTDTIWRVISVKPDFSTGKILFRCLQIFFRAANPPVIPTPWNGIIALTVPGVPTIAIPVLSKIEETPVAADTIALTVPPVPGVAVTVAVYNLADTDGVCTISHAAPAIVSIVGHGLSDDQEILFQTNGTLPTPLVAGTHYFVAAIGANTFNLSLTAPGSNIDTTTDGSGTHKVLGKVP